MNVTSTFPRTAVAHPPDADASVADKLAWAVNFAVLAPSKHNSQPWRFDVTREAVDLYADGSRSLTVSDPMGREFVISCGAALANLRLGIRALGHEADVHIFPQGAWFNHLARIRLGAPSRPGVDEELLIDAVPLRGTQRLPVDGTDLDRGVLVELQDLVELEGAHLFLVEAPGHRRGTAALVQRAEHRLAQDEKVVGELREWVRDEGDFSRDGIPAYSVGLGSPGDKEEFALRDFNVNRQGDLPGPQPADRPLIALIWTDRDDAADWLRAGQALEMLLLRAAVDDITGSYLNQPIEIAPLRTLLRDELALRGFPQLLLRLGRGTRPLPTPRRSASAVGGFEA